MTRSDFAELRYAVNQLRQSIGVLRSHYGDAGTVRRLENDLERLCIDADEFEQSPPPPVGASFPLTRESMSRSEAPGWVKMPAPSFDVFPVTWTSSRVNSPSSLSMPPPVGLFPPSTVRPRTRTTAPSET